MINKQYSTGYQKNPEFLTYPAIVKFRKCSERTNQIKIWIVEHLTQYNFQPMWGKKVALLFAKSGGGRRRTGIERAVEIELRCYSLLYFPDLGFRDFLQSKMLVF